MEQPKLFDQNLVNLKEAAVWASDYLARNVTPANVSYLIQYGQIRKHGNNGRALIDVEELRKYYDNNDKEQSWKAKLGDDLNWALSFSQYREAERTKHVHRLHPYKGKFIPQLVEYFLDAHTDAFKKRQYFHKGDIVLDPFCGSGTALVQANELGIHALGIDISAFNTVISNVKVARHDTVKLGKAIAQLTDRLKHFQSKRKNIAFEQQLLAALSQFNAQHFPSPNYKRQVRLGEINETTYSAEKEKLFLTIYHRLLKEHGITIQQDGNDTFLDKWFLLPIREEINFLFGEITRIKNKNVRKVLGVILSRAVRSCRATTHADLGTLKAPVTATYYCKKHGKICKPIFSISGWWRRYTEDTLARLRAFDQLRTQTYQVCLTGDACTLDIGAMLGKYHPEFAKLLRSQRVHGIFSSPPYVGLIDYHEQHAYSYELFGFDRKDELEIGSLTVGTGRKARETYVKGISEVLKNSKRWLRKDYDVFLVANDKFDLYPTIAGLSGMQIVDRFKRPVLNRVEKDRSHAYSESIFHLKEK